MEEINVKILNNNITVTVPKGVTLLEIEKNYNKEAKNKILAASIDNEIRELSMPLSRSCSVEFLDITNDNGFRVYQRSVSFLMICAAKEILGKKTKVFIKHSINKNYYCEIPEIDLTDEILSSIEERMFEIVEQDKIIERLSMHSESGVEIFNKLGRESAADALKFVRSTNVNLYRLNDFYDYMYGPMVPSAGYLTLFKINKHNGGFILQFASRENPDSLIELKILNKISSVFEESSRWAKILKVDTVGALNNIICDGNIGDIILINEALHEKRIANISDMITNQHKEIILIAGPSSSGKTTFAKRLCIQLRVNGIKPYVISLDDYYLDRDKTPLDENGKPDFEALEAIDIKKFNEDLTGLLNGETVEIPTFNFITGKREYKGNFIKLHSDEVLVIEGIHGLNEKLTASVSRNKKFKIYISALTQINIDEHNRIPTTDTRIIRRIVRDHNYRGFNALTTIDIWPSVKRGESNNIFPFQEEADAMFNSALVYELSILKIYAEPLLFKISRDNPEYVEAKRLIKFLDNFLAIGSDHIPSNSIVREFIGGSCFNT